MIIIIMSIIMIIISSFDYPGKKNISPCEHVSDHMHLWQRLEFENTCIHSESLSSLQELLDAVKIQRYAPRWVGCGQDLSALWQDLSALWQDLSTLRPDLSGRA